MTMPSGAAGSALMRIDPVAMSMSLGVFQKK